MTETMTLIDPTIFKNQKPIINNETPDVNSPESLPPVDKSPFRRIEFQLAKKPFSGFANGGGDGSFQLETLNPYTPSSKSGSGSQLSTGSGSDVGKKRDVSEMENGLDSELSLGITFKRIGAGLENLGNTCFLNSVLQCLTYTEPLAAYLQSGKHQVTCRKSGFCALCAIQKHVSRALQLSGRSLAPKDLVSNLRCISRTFRNSRQEDAHEYMVNLLESMHKCCLPNGVPSESQSAYDRSLVHKIFGGRLRSQVKCMQCNYCSNKFDPFLDLSLEILKADTLSKAFANFTAKEQLDGGDKQYQCQQCKQKVKALKQLSIHKAPNVLTVHLKRFGSHMSGQKIDKKIQFGSTLDLKPFVTGPYEGDLKYTLYGVLVHAGWSTHSGHYYCFVRTSSGMWYSLDDNRVYQVSEKKVFEQKAYMLFYFKDRKNFPSKKTTTDFHQKEKIVMNGKVNGPGVAKEAQLKTAPSNGSLNSNKSLASVGPEKTGFSSVVPKEPQVKTGPNDGSLNGHKSFGSEGNGISPVAPKEAQMKTGLINGSSNGQNSMANVNTEIRGLSPIAPKETQTKTNLSNRSLNGHKSAVTVGTVKNAFSTGVPEQIQKKEGSVSKSISETTLESSLKGKNGDFSVENSKPLAIPVDTASKTESAPKDIGIGESSGGNNSGDIQIKEAATALRQSSGLPKLESRMEIKASGKKTRKKVKNFLKCKGISMKFSSKAFIGSSLNQRKKQKHKQSKRVKNLARETSVSEGPSSSIKIETKLAVKPPIENGFKERVETPVENGFKLPVNKDVAILPTTDYNVISNGIRSEPTGPSRLDSCKGVSTQKDLVHMLTRGVDDIAVPRWDEDESTPSQRRERTRDLKIGYIGDEWDEEYDRGKKKKVRMSQTEFDGKNPFQSIANERLKTHAQNQNLSKRRQLPSMMTKNNQFKKPRSGNSEPYRI